VFPVAALFPAGSVVSIFVTDDRIGGCVNSPTRRLTIEATYDLMATRVSGRNIAARTYV
jgi:hypothetical protein